MALAEDDHVVETFAVDRSDQSLDEGVLPGRARRAQDFLARRAPRARADGTSRSSAADPKKVASLPSLPK
jgi:hypothetical protein